MLNEPILCEFCVADNELRLELHERGVPVDKCPLCHQSGGRALSATDNRVAKIFRALIRLNFSEWAYNTHLGGEQLQDLVFTSKVIFNLGADCSELQFEEVFLAMDEQLGWYPASEEDIALGGGYWDGCTLDGLRDRRTPGVESVIKEALERNPFEIEPDARKLIQTLRSDISQVIVAGTEFFRGRIGVQARLKRKSHDILEDQRFRYLPYSGTHIDRPPLTLAIEGRFNRARVSILYLASDTHTAVAELRPHPGHMVSTAKFRLKRNLNVAQFALSCPFWDVPLLPTILQPRFPLKYLNGKFIRTI